MEISVSVDTWEVDEGLSTCINYFSPYKSNLRKWCGKARWNCHPTISARLASKTLGATCLRVLGL